MSLIDKVIDKVGRHKERHDTLGYDYVFSDSIDFVQQAHWDAVAEGQTMFLSRDYLRAIEQCSPENTCQRYAMAYGDGEPVIILACQLAEIGGERLTKPDEGLTKSLSSSYRERVLVCGNLVSSGLHGVAFAQGLDEQTGWRIVAELLYRMRRAEKLSGNVDFVMIKDIDVEALEASSVVERFSYRRVQTDPDMVLELDPDTRDFDAYLGMLSSKYRSRIRKIIKTIDQAGLTCDKLSLDDAMDIRLHELYTQVEQQAKTRLASLPAGYFMALSESLGDRFACYGIRDGEEILGFISIIKDRDTAIAYYVGFDYQRNEQHPLYFRLLQLVVDAALEMQCSTVRFGRSALEPKACLGAKPVDTFIWARHRVPVVNFFVRKLFRNVPFDEAPERSALKKG